LSSAGIAKKTKAMKAFTRKGMGVAAGLAMLFASCCLAAQAGGITFTQPVTSPTLQGNQTYMVMWQFDGSKFGNVAAKATLQLGISRGGDTNVEIIKVITDTIDISSGVYTWNVPNDVETSNQYSLVMTAEGFPFYTPKFTIQRAGSSPTSPSPPPPPAGSPSTTSSAATPTPPKTPTAPGGSGGSSLSTATATLLAMSIPIALGFAYLRNAQL